MKKFLFYLKRAILLLILASAIGLVILLNCEIRLPDSFRDSLCARLSNDATLVRVSDVMLKLPRSVRLRDIRVLDRTRLTARPVLSAESADIRLRPHKMFDSRGLVSDIVVRALRYPRLPEGYYIADSIEFPGQPDYLERNEPVELPLPALDPFSLTLYDADILGIAPARAEIPEVSVSSRGIRAKTLRLIWPERDADYVLDGACELDLEAQQVRGYVHGQSSQRHIRPLLDSLDVQSALTYMDAFTDVVGPVDATCRFDVNLVNSDLHIGLDLHPAGGKYNGVPLKDTHGAVDVRCGVRGTNQNVRVTVGPLAVALADGAALAGTVVCIVSNDIGRVELDARSDAPLAETLAVADVLTDGTLDCIRADEKPFVSIAGTVAGNPANAETLTDFGGTLAFARGSVFGVPLKDATAHYAMRGTTVTFSDAHAKGPGGGTYKGGGRISFPEFDRAKGSFALDLDIRQSPLAELAGLFDKKLDDGQSGTVDGYLHLTGPLDSDPARLAGTGYVSCACANIAKIDFFRSFVNALVDLFPNTDGRATFDQNARITFSFSFADGKLRTDDLRIRSGNVVVFAVDADGTYDFLKDDLDVHAKVVLFKKSDREGALAFAAGVADTLATPFTSFMEARLTGPLASPKKESVNPIKKIPFGKLKEVIPFL